MLRHSSDRDSLPDDAPTGRVPAPPEAAFPCGECVDGPPLTNCCKDLQHQTSPSAVSPSDHTKTGVSQVVSDATGEETLRIGVKAGESRGLVTPATAHMEASGAVTLVSSTRHMPRHAVELAEPALENDRAVLRAIVDLKYLSAPQLQRYRGYRAVTSIRRSLHRLAANGWIILWEHWTPVGGRTKYALPQRKALAWALGVAQEEALGTAAEPLSRTLLTTLRRPVRFPKGTTPPFFLHQVRTNDVVLALRSVTDVRMLWATAWDRPLPEKIGAFAPPQPDAILLLERNSAPFLLFLEMDRATQKLGEFRLGKSRYAGLGLRPQVLLDAFGTTDFRTVVVVEGKTRDGTHRRIQELRRLARAGGFAAPLMLTSLDHVQRHSALFLHSMLALPQMAAG